MAEVTICAGQGRRLRVRKVRPSEWTNAKRAAFLDHLAVSCNVSESVEAVGMTLGGVYMLRRRDPEFAELWRRALLTGYDRLEELLLRYAGAGVDPEAGAGAAVNAVAIGETVMAERPFDPRMAFDLLKHHRATAEGGQRKQLGGKFHRADRATAEKALLKKLDALAKRLRAEAAPGSGEGA